MRIGLQFLHFAAFHGVAWLVAVMLVFVPPSGAVCWPLLDGWHLNIGWSTAAGQPTVGLVVYAHRGSAVVLDPHDSARAVVLQSSGCSAPAARDVVNLSDLRPLATHTPWLRPMLVLEWLCLPDSAQPHQTQPSPLEYPPKPRFAF